MAMNMIWDLEMDEDYDTLEETDLLDEIDLGEETLIQDLIPGLPEEIALECLLRVSHTVFTQLQGVCRKWDNIVTSQNFYEERRRVGATQNLLCIVQALPEPDFNDPSAGGKHASAPVFGLTIYDWKQKGWARLPPIPDFPEGLPVFCRCVGLNGKLVLLGGWHPSTYEALRTVYVFNFSTQSWKRGTDMSSARSFFGCGIMGNNVFVAGGHDDNKNALASAEAYFVDEDRWEELPPMSEERDECGVVALDGKVLVISGYSNNNQGQFVSSAEIYDPVSGRWSRLEDMWMERVSPGPFTLWEGNLYAIQKHNLMRYDSEKNLWTVVDAIPLDGATAICATAICDSLVLMTIPDSGDRNKSAVHKRRLDVEGVGKWEVVNSESDFSGLVRASCSVEV